MNKTKAQLVAEIEELKAQIPKAQAAEDNEKNANLLMDIYQAYLQVGFDKEQAWEIFITQVKGVSQPKRTLF